jgi:hypothetical protein
MTYADRDFNRYTRNYLKDNPNEREAIQKEHMDRIRLGVEAWNKFDAAFAEYIKQHNILDFCYDFGGAIFSEGVDFSEAIFSGDANFHKATFSWHAFFTEATFSGEVDFSEATFSGNADFMEATFSDLANFNDAKFNGNAPFFKATFSEDAYFHGATFSRNADFWQATFSGNVSFGRVTFYGFATFISVESKSLFSFRNVKAKNMVPVFSGIDYKIPPIVDGLSVPEPGKNKNFDIDLYRQLKMIAIAGANHEKEVEFFGHEMQCKLYQGKTPILSKALIWLYWTFSNFGQSILGPVLGLFFVFLMACSSTHITVESGQGPIPCENAKNTGAFESKSDAAWSQSIDFILPILKADRGTLRQRNQCLYGHDGVPGINRVINFIQQIVSLVFLFLAGLAIRNRFKLK